jgi:hypothetical protein
VNDRADSAPLPAAGKTFVGLVAMELARADCP